MTQLYPLSALEAPGRFRLVDIHPGDREAPLRCSISESPLIDCPSYEALSYAWGGNHAEAGKPSMILNEQPFPVTLELEKALRRLRRPDAKRTMWVDWICINQADMAERSAQVALMRDIYRGAERVIAWIGEESEDSGRAMAFLREMAMAKKRDTRCSWVDGVRQGSATSSECGDGTRIPGAGSDLGNSGESAVEDDGSDSETGSEIQTVGANTGWKSFHLPVWITSPSARIRRGLKYLIFLPRRLRWSRLWKAPPLSSLPEIDRAKYDEWLEERKQNQTRWGHQVVGYPVLYYMFQDTYDAFFEDSRQADWEALDNLLARPWWSRTWVVQEVWHSANALLQCGGTTLKWKTVEKAMCYQEGWDDMGCLVKKTSRWQLWDTLKRRYGLAVHISQKRLLGSKLSDLLWNMWDREATDPRDKVFAVLGLVGEEYAEPLPCIDYSKPMGRIYRETAASVIRGEKSLDILLAASGAGSGEDELPSWVPDWRREANDERPALFINGSRMRILVYFSGSTDVVLLHGHGYSASGDMEPSVRFDEELNVLHARGFLFDVVAHVTSVEEGVAASHIVEAARSTLMPSVEAHPGLRGVTNDDLKVILRAGGFADPSTLRPEDQVIENIMRRRSFFVTTSGRLGIGPSDTRQGDDIAILAGCNFPMVLRPGDSSHHIVVGEAYVHKSMAGEILRDAATPVWREISLH